jgi:hypothetical protein
MTKWWPAVAAAGFGAAVLVSACGSSGGVAGNPGPRGTLSGVVVTGPVCPVERVPPESACRPRPVSGAHVTISTGGRTVASIHTDKGGGFALELPYGSYVVTATNPGALHTTAQQPVHIGPRGAKARLLVDSGIR